MADLPNRKSWQYGCNELSCWRSALSIVLLFKIHFVFSLNVVVSVAKNSAVGVDKQTPLSHYSTILLQIHNVAQIC